MIGKPTHKTIGDAILAARRGDGGTTLEPSEWMSVERAHAMSQQLLLDGDTASQVQAYIEDGCLRIEPIAEP
jgi:hypothetical protein